MLEPRNSSDLTRATVGVLFIVTLAFASLWIMRPFLLPLVWATTIVIATWPVLLRVEARLGKRRWAAAWVMVGVLVLVFLIPSATAVAILVANADSIRAAAAELQTLELPAPPSWVADLPLLGESIASQWRQLAARGPTGLGAWLQPHATGLAVWLLGHLREFGLLLVDFALTTVLAAILYMRGEIAATAVRQFAHRLAGPPGEASADLAGRAIRSVALGVIVTALLQSCVGGIGLFATGVPLPAMWTAALLFLSIAQIGAAPVLAIATVWLFAQGAVGAGVVLAVWTIVVGSMDNVIRPILIRRGVQLPLLLIFAGVIGGLVAFGVIGIFVGPVLLAVTYTLVGVWVTGEPAAAAAR